MLDSRENSLNHRFSKFRIIISGRWAKLERLIKGWKTKFILIFWFINLFSLWTFFLVGFFILFVLLNFKEWGSLLYFLLHSSNPEFRYINRLFLQNFRSLISLYFRTRIELIIIYGHHRAYTRVPLQLLIL